MKTICIKNYNHPIYKIMAKCKGYENIFENKETALASVYARFGKVKIIDKTK